MLKRWAVAIAVVCFYSNLSWAQFGSSIQGVIQDPTGGVVPNAALSLHETQTGITQNAKTNGDGFYRFSALPPGTYEVTVTSSGFISQRQNLTLSTNQSRDLNFSVQVQSSATQVVQVQDTAPLLDTAETRQQLTIDQKTIRDLPLQGNSIFNTLALAPGITGTNGATDNFNPEYFSGMSGNGRSAYGNTFNVDGVNTSSNITNGTSNVMINPEAVQEVSIQTNTFTAEQGTASSVVVSMTTRAGTNQFHGAGNYWFTNQSMLARTSLPFITGYAPFIRQDVDGAFGGPVIKNKTFFFASTDALFSKNAQTNTLTFEAPEFVNWASQNYPNTFGTKLFQQYPTKGITNAVVQSRASDLFPGNCGGSTNLPCNLPVLDQGTFSVSPPRNGLQYTFRGDQYVGTKDRIYASYIHQDSNSGQPSARPAFDSSNDNLTDAGQANWTRTFAPTLINELSFGATYVQGTNGSGGLFTIPSIGIQNVSGMGGNSSAMGQSFGGTFFQHNYTWRDVVTWVKGTHTLKFGGTYYWGDDQALFAGGNSRPSYNYSNILQFVQDQPYSGNFGTYDPLTGKPNAYNFGAKLKTDSLFAQDEWKVRPNLNITLSLRWDDFGNPSAVAPWKMTNTFVSSGTTVDQQFSNASVHLTDHPFSHRLNRNFSPRFGFAWSPKNNNKTSIHGGIGLYNDWITLGETVDRVNGNPPNFIYPNFGQTLPLKPVLSLGTSNTYPYGFSLPSIPAAALDSRGGIIGLSAGVGGLDPNLTPPKSLNYIFGIDQQIGTHTVVSASYNGSHSWDGLDGTDYNRVPGDLFDGTLNRLNPSFGSMWYITNFDKIDYNAALVSVRTELGNSGSLQASYNWSHAIDYFDGGQRSVGFEQVADPRNLGARRGDTNFDIRHRVSASGVYRLPTPFKQNFISRTVLGGWELGSTLIVQTGAPYGWYTNAAFDPVLDANGKVIGLKPDSGDYNADGFGEDYPNQLANLPRKFDRNSFLGANAGKAAYTSADFSQPAPGTEGNGLRGYFRQQGLFDMDASLLKNNKLSFLGENWNLQLKFEFFNVLNRVNLGGINNNVTDPNFGKILGQASPGGPRSIQIGGRISF